MSLLQYARQYFVVITTLTLAMACADSDQQTNLTSETAAGMDSLVSAEWLSQHINDPDLVVLDCSVLIEQVEGGSFQPVSGRANYEAGHIPTAGFADLMGDLSDGDSPLQFAVPDPEQFAAAMESLGVGDDTRVVLYDSGGSAWAARVWWMLRWVGFDNAALLDGGLNAWTANGLELSTTAASRPAGELTVALRPELIADRNEVLAAIEDDSVSIIDALPESHYRGETSMYGRPGHIPGASNVPVFSLLDDEGKYRPVDELGDVFAADRNERAINYCGGGIAASSNAFVMTRLGYKDVSVYTASLQEWATDPENPLEVSPASDDSEK